MRLYLSLVNEMFKELERDFCNIKGNELINDWKSISNKWYYHSLSRYQYELQKYIVENLFDYLEQKYKQFNISDMSKIDVFKYISSTRYKDGLFNKKGSLLPNNIKDYNFICDCLYKNDFLTIAHILSNAENSMDIYNVIKSNWYYDSVSSNKISYILGKMEMCKNKEVFDRIFDDLCLKDSEYGFELINVLENNVKELNSNNILSIIKNIYIGGDYIRDSLNENKRSSTILDIINEKDIKIKEENSKFTLETLNEISNDINGDFILEIINSLNCEEIEKINFYLPKVKIKKV